MATRDYSFSGKGTIRIKKRGVAGPSLFLGNASSAAFSADEDERSVPDYTRAGGGKANSIRRVTAVKFSLTLVEWTFEAMKVALRALGTSVSAAAVVDEAHTAYLGGYIDFDFLPDMSVLPVVKNTAGTTTYVKDSDYELANGGIVILADGAITDAQGLKISYTKLPSYVLEALMTSGDEYEVIFDGLNEYDSGKPAVVKAHRLKFGITNSLGLISDDASPLELEGEVLSDPTIVGDSLSKFIKIKMAA